MEDNFERNTFLLVLNVAVVQTFSALTIFKENPFHIFNESYRNWRFSSINILSTDFKVQVAASESDAEDLPTVGIEEMLEDLNLEDQEMASDSE